MTLCLGAFVVVNNSEKLVKDGLTIFESQCIR